MSARELRALFALLAVLAAVAIPLTSIPVGSASAGQVESGPETAPERSTTIDVQLETDGDARWTITTRFETETDAERAAFEELVADYADDGRSVPWFDTVRAAKDASTEATGRSMRLEDVETSSNVTNSTLSLSFTWTNFARTDGDRVVVDDAFNTTDGTWLDGLTADQTLVIELPPGYGVRSAPLGARVQNGRVQWTGPASFEPGYMRLVYSGDPPTDTTTTDPGRDSGLLWGGFFVLGLGIVVLGAYVLSQRRDGVPSTGRGDRGPTAPEAEPFETDAAGERASDAEETESDEPAAESGADDVDEELLSDEERVERLLESNGGRMKQATIVNETGWSNAKVSQLLSSMADDGRVDKLRIGRENLISFPDEDVTDVDRE